MSEVSDLYAVVDKSKKKKGEEFGASESEKSTKDVYAVVDKGKKIKGKTSIHPIPVYDTTGGGHKLVQNSYILRGKLLWICGLIAILVFIIAGIVALAVAFALIAGLRSEISAVKKGLNYRCQQLYISNKVFLKNSESQILEISRDTSAWKNEIQEGLEHNLKALEDYYNLLNVSTARLLLVRDYLNSKISTTFLNLSLIRQRQEQLVDRADVVNQNCGMLVNSTARRLANDIRAQHVFSSCDSTKSLELPFPSGTYKIGTSVSNFSLTDCSTNMACNGISGQWRRVAYLDMNEPNMNCPGRLQAVVNPSSCRINVSEAKCSSVFFSSNNRRYSKVCGRIHAYYHGEPDGLGLESSPRPESAFIDDVYVDGISLTYGMSSRYHIWTFSATVDQNNNQENDCMSCHYSPPFVGPHYFCEFVTASPNTCPTQELWNGGESCRDGEVFYRNLSMPTSEDLEMRVCRDQLSTDEDILLSYVEIFVSV